MLKWALGFLIFALIAGLFGFGLIAGVAVDIAKILFVVGLVLFAITALAGVFRGTRTV